MYYYDVSREKSAEIKVTYCADSYGCDHVGKSHKRLGVGIREAVGAWRNRRHAVLLKSV